MGAYKVKPNFNRIKNSVTFAADALNSFARENIVDNFSFYQQMFNVFSWMQFTSENTFRLHTLSGSPLIWQSHNSCAMDRDWETR